MKLFWEVARLIVAPIVILIIVVVVLGSAGNSALRTSPHHILTKVGRVAPEDIVGGMDAFYVLLTCIAALVAVNTFLFALELIQLLDESRSAIGKGYRKASLIIVYALTVISLLWPAAILFGFTTKEFNEGFVLFLFAAFACVDFLMMRQHRAGLATKGIGNRNAFEAMLVSGFSPQVEQVAEWRARFRTIENLSEYVSLRRGHLYSMHQLYFVDAPVVISVSLLIFFSHYINDLGYYPSPFVNGINTGGIVMHLAMSQVIFIIISMQNALREVRCERALDYLARSGFNEDV